MGIFDEKSPNATENYVSTVSGVITSQIITDHGQLTGKEDDDHTQYIRTDGSRGFTSTVSGVDPVLPNDLITKKYFEDVLTGTSSGTEQVGNILYGSEFYYEEDDTISSTNSTDWQNKITLTTVGIPEGDYRVGFYYLWTHSKSNTEFLGRVILDDTVIIYNQDSRVSRVNYYLATSGFYYYENVVSGTHYIDIEYRSSSGGSTSYIKNARLEFWRVQ